jgi:hypothetical protein
MASMNFTYFTTDGRASLDWLVVGVNGDNVRCMSSVQTVCW